MRQALQLVKAQTLAAQEHQDLPFEQVVEISGQPRTMAHSPCSMVMFAWENNEVTELNLPDLTLLPAAAPDALAQTSQSLFDLLLFLAEAGDRIVGGLRYARRCLTARLSIATAAICATRLRRWSPTISKPLIACRCWTKRNANRR